MQLTQGPMGETATLKWAEDTIRTIEDYWLRHRAGAPELTGAQCNFLIDVQRAAEKYRLYCHGLKAGNLDHLLR